MASEPSAENVASRAFERAYGWLATPRDSLPMCAARAGLGATLFAAYLQYLPFALVLFGPHGIGGHDTLARHPDFPGNAYEWYTRIRVLHLATSDGVVGLLYGLLLASAAAFAVGFRPRLFGIIAAGLHMVFYAHTPHIDGGWTALIGPFIFYLVLADCGSQLSVDAWLRRRRGDVEDGPARAAPWGMRLLQVHLCTMYMVPGFDRLDSPGWVDGQMVLRSLANTDFGRFDVDWFGAAPILRVVSWMVLVLEPAAPFILWLRHVGRWWAVLLIVMHVGLEIFLDTGWWQPMMISALLTFLPPRWLRRWLPRVVPSSV